MLLRTLTHLNNNGQGDSPPLELKGIAAVVGAIDAEVGSSLHEDKPSAYASQLAFYVLVIHTF